MKKALFIDRDGTILAEPPDEQIDSLEKVRFVPGAIVALHRIAAELDYELVLVTNQDGLGTPSFPEENFWPAHHLMRDVLAGEGIHFQAEHIDRSFSHQGLDTRKPGTGMLTAYLAGGYDLAASYVIGDRWTDVLLAENLGARAIWLADGPPEKTSDALVLTTRHWPAVYQHLRFPDRVADVRRTTRETDVRVQLNLDGQGRADLATGLGFFDHMLEQLARHGGLDLTVHVKGDLHVDEHHTVEDTALALGEAFDRALGDKRGVERYGFLLPMDDALAQVAVDFSGRNWLVWEADFRRERIGDVPTELFFHFFKSFADAARCNLNIRVTGDNEHHKIEAVFKAWARAVRRAVARDFRNPDQLPSTKGTL